MQHWHLVGVSHLSGPRGETGEGDGYVGIGMLDGYGLGQSLTGRSGRRSLSVVVDLK